jgi:DNA-binding GntR family transcriptional regulator
MARTKTANTPDLSPLLGPANPLTNAVEQAIMRGKEWSRAAVPIAEQIAIRLAGAISLDLIHAGQRLLEQDISEALRISRAPVREALRILERERLVEFAARRGAVVTSPDIHDLRDIYAVRGALYTILLERLMDERPTELQALLERQLPKLAKAAESSPDEYAVENFLLNLAMNGLSGNRLAGDLLASILLRTLRYVRLGFVMNPAGMAESLKSWRDLKRAVDKRDLALVLKAAQKRLDGSFASTVRAVDGAAGASSKAQAVPLAPRPSKAVPRPAQARAAPRRQVDS